MQQRNGARSSQGRCNMNDEMRFEGQIVRLLPNKGFGFVRIKNRKEDHFFHKDDYSGDWFRLLETTPLPYVTCIVVESNKGPRVADVTPI